MFNDGSRNDCSPNEVSNDESNDRESNDVESNEDLNDGASNDFFNGSSGGPSPPIIADSPLYAPTTALTKSETNPPPFKFSECNKSNFNVLVMYKIIIIIFNKK